MNIWLMNDIVNSLIQIKIDTTPPPSQKKNQLNSDQYGIYLLNDT